MLDASFKLFDSEGVALVNLLRHGSSALEQMRERAQGPRIVLDEHLVLPRRAAGAGRRARAATAVGRPRMAVRQAITAPLAGALQGVFAGGGFAATLHEGGIVGETTSPLRYVPSDAFEHAPRYHAGGFTGFGFLPDEVPIIARRGELVVPPERIVREEKTAREQRPITVVVNVTAADANSFRASQGQIAAEMARAVDRASRNR